MKVNQERVHALQVALASVSVEAHAMRRSRRLGERHSERVEAQFICSEQELLRARRTLQQMLREAWDETDD